MDANLDGLQSDPTTQPDLGDVARKAASRLGPQKSIRSKTNETQVIKEQKNVLGKAKGSLLIGLLTVC